MLYRKSFRNLLLAMCLSGCSVPAVFCSADDRVLSESRAPAREEDTAHCCLKVFGPIDISRIDAVLIDLKGVRNDIQEEIAKIDEILNAGFVSLGDYDDQRANVNLDDTIRLQLTDYRNELNAFDQAIQALENNMAALNQQNLSQLREAMAHVRASRSDVTFNDLESFTWAALWLLEDVNRPECLSQGDRCRASTTLIDDKIQHCLKAGLLTLGNLLEILRWGCPKLSEEQKAVVRTLIDADYLNPPPSFYCLDESNHICSYQPEAITLLNDVVFPLIRDRLTKLTHAVEAPIKAVLSSNPLCSWLDEKRAELTTQLNEEQETFSSLSKYNETRKGKPKTLIWYSGLRLDQGKDPNLMMAFAPITRAMLNDYRKGQDIPPSWLEDNFIIDNTYRSSLELDKTGKKVFYAFDLFDVKWDEIYLTQNMPASWYEKFYEALAPGGKIFVRLNIYFSSRPLQEIQNHSRPNMSRGIQSWGEFTCFCNRQGSEFDICMQNEGQSATYSAEDNQTIFGQPSDVALANFVNNETNKRFVIRSLTEGAINPDHCEFVLAKYVANDPASVFQAPGPKRLLIKELFNSQQRSVGESMKQEGIAMIIQKPLKQK